IMTADVVWMTPAALARLQEELETLTAPGRELDDAQKARVVELRELLKKARAESKPDDGLVEPGMRITARFEDDGTTIDFVLGSRSVLGLDESMDVDVYSPESPLGAAINGLYVGDKATFETPTGERPLTILAAKPAS